MKKKRLILGIVFIISFVLYTLALDPDINLFSDLPFGAGLLLSLQIVLMFGLGLALVEILTDFFTDRYFNMFDNDRILERIEDDPLALSIYMIGWGLRLLGYSIMFGMIVLAYIGNH